MSLDDAIRREQELLARQGEEQAEKDRLDLERRERVRQHAARIDNELIKTFLQRVNNRQGRARLYRPSGTKDRRLRWLITTDVGNLIVYEDGNWELPGSEGWSTWREIDRSSIQDGVGRLVDFDALQRGIARFLVKNNLA